MTIPHLQIIFVRGGAHDEFAEKDFAGLRPSFHTQEPRTHDTVASTKRDRDIQNKERKKETERHVGQFETIRDT